MERSIAVSNNTYYYTLAHDLGIDKLHERMTNFGFGQRVAHDVQGESTGLMPSRDWKRARFNQPGTPVKRYRWELAKATGRSHLCNWPVPLPRWQTVDTG